MTLYFFHRQSDITIQDSVGTEFNDVADVQREAIIFAAENLKDNPNLLLSGHGMTIQVLDEEGLPVFAVKIRADVA